MKQCPFCGAQLEDSFMFCASCGNAQPGVQQAAPQQPVPQQPVPQQYAPQQPVPQQYAPQQYAPQQYAPQQYAPQQPVPAPKPPKQPGKFHYLMDDLMRKYILLAFTGLLALMALLNLVDNIPLMGVMSRSGGAYINVFFVICILFNIGAGVMSFFSWKLWKKDKKMGPVFMIIASSVSIFFNLIYVIFMLVSRGIMRSSYGSYQGINLGGLFVHFPMFNLLMFLASIAMLVFTIMVLARLKSKFHK